MLALKRFSQFDISLLPLRYIVPTFAGFTLVCTSFLPWLRDPLMGPSSAWKIPVYIGWPLRTSFINYGVLCLWCAFYMFFLAWTSQSPDEISVEGSSSRSLFVQSVKAQYTRAALICLVPLLLFCLQYLIFDVQSINQLAQHKLQALLIAQHLEYRLAPQRIPVRPFSIDISLLPVRLLLLVDQISLGSFLPVFGSLALLAYRLLQRPASMLPFRVKQNNRARWIALSLAVLLGGGLFGRVPLSLFCEYQANLALSSGNYDAASQWLGDAVFLDPGLNQVAYYHIQLGQIRFFIEHDNQGDDSLAYLAFSYYQGGDYINAYQHLFGAWTRNRNTTWIIDQMSFILMQEIEVNRPISLSNAGDDNPDLLLVSAQENDKSLPLLESLLQVNPNNVYARYVSGRVNYDLHEYVDCTTQMQFVNQLSQNRDFQSAAFTSIGLSEEGQGDLPTSRVFLEKAVSLDPNYFNNVAREELSGLH